jgi:hypothetical protein
MFDDDDFENLLYKKIDTITIEYKFLWLPRFCYFMNASYVCGPKKFRWLCKTYFRTVDLSFYIDKQLKNCIVATGKRCYFDTKENYIKFFSMSKNKSTIIYQRNS